MPRGCGLALLVCSVIGLVLSGIGTVLAMEAVNRGGGPVAVVFILFGVTSVAVLAIAVTVLRKHPTQGADRGGHAGTDLFPLKKPITRALDGTSYTVLYVPPVKGKNARPSVLTYSTPIDYPGEFEMVVENWFDKLCKRFGLAVELQTGDRAFDEKCYIRSDTTAAAAAYLSDPLKRTAIIDLRRFGFDRLTLKDGTLTAARTGFDPAGADAATLDGEVAARLVLLARRLPAPRPEFAARTGTHRKLWQLVLWVALVVFAVQIESLFSFPPVETSDLLWRAALGLLTWPVAAYVAAWLLSGTSRSHLAWGALAVGALFLYPVGTAGTVARVNGAFDRSPDVTHDAVIVEKYSTKSKNKTNYHIRCASWRPGGGTISFGVPYDQYRDIVPHRSRVVAVTRAGALGMEWVRSKRIELDGNPGIACGPDKGSDPRRGGW